MLWLQLAWKEIRNNARFSAFFVLNLGIGLIGFIALDSFNHSIERYLTLNSKAILTADIQVNSRFPITDKEIAFIDKFLDTNASGSNRITMLSMLAANNNSRMGQLIATDGKFPFYGDIVLEREGSVQKSKARDHLLEGDNVWVGRDLMQLLNLHIGDSVKIGGKDFTIIDTVLEEPSATVSSLTSFPSIYMGLAQIESTGLIQVGSRVSYSRFYKLPEDYVLEGLGQRFLDAVLAEFAGERRLALLTHYDQSEQLGRILGYMNDYLGLVALIALFLAGVGAAYLFRSFFTTRFKDMAILMCLGGTPKQAYWMTLLQIVVLGCGSALAASVVAWFALPLIPSLFAGYLPKDFVNRMDFSSLALAFFMGTLGSVICCLPILAKIYDLNPLALFHEKVQPSSFQRHWQRNALSYLPIVGVFWALSIAQAHSKLLGSLFVLVFILAIGVLGGVGWLILRACGQMSSLAGVIRKLALRNLDRNRTAALSCFLAIGMGSLLINVIPQIQKGLQQEIVQPTKFAVPDFFMFDIQAEQLDTLQNVVKEQGHSLSFLSPQVSARLDAINEKPLGENTETEQEQIRFRRQFNLTYQDKLKDSEALVAGEMWQGPWQADSAELPGISVEEGFANRMNLKIGDVLKFDVQSVEIEGRIMNLRKVSWNSFQPNFMISFQSGVLDPAPKTFVAAISQVPAADRLKLQNSIVGAVPNASIINVQQVVGRILDITNQISWAIRVMAYLSILAGLVVLFSIARYEVKSRFWDINLLKILGANFGDVKGMVQLEFGILGFCAAFTGVVLSFAMSYSLSWYIFDHLWQFDGLLTLGSILAITGMSLLTALAATLSVLRQKPLELLRSGN